MIERPSLHALAVFLAVVEHGTMTAAAEAEGHQPTGDLGPDQGSGALLRNAAAPAHGSRGRADADRAGCRRPCANGSWRWSTSWIAWCATSRVSRVGGSSSAPAVPSASNSFRHTWVRFHAAYPDVELEVRIGNTGEITAAVVRRELDFAFVGSPPADRRADRRTGLCRRGRRLRRPRRPPAARCPHRPRGVVRAPIRPARARLGNARPRVALPGRGRLRAGARHRARQQRGGQAGGRGGVGHRAPLDARHRGRTFGGAPRGPPAPGLGVRPVVLAHPASRPCAHPGRAGVPGTAAAAGNGAVALSSDCAAPRSRRKVRHESRACESRLLASGLLDEIPRASG